MERTLWHPAAVQAFGNELEDHRDDLAIEAEVQLTTEPLRIDILIIKKKRDVVIKKNIAKIFVSVTLSSSNHPKPLLRLQLITKHRLCPGVCFVE